MWLEMPKDGNHGGKGWEFGRCLWTPTETAKGGQRADWNLLLKVRLGDPVIHLRGKDGKAAFVGVSIAERGGWQTSRRPPEPGAWGYAQKYQEFHLVELTGYKPLPEPIPLEECFAASQDALAEYYSDNRKRGSKGKTLFFEIRKGRLQCRSRAYLSELSPDLQEILWGPLVNLSKGKGKRSGRLARKEDALRRLLDQKDLAWRACEICRILPVNLSWPRAEESQSTKDRIRDARARLEDLKLGNSWPAMDRKLERCPLCFTFYLGWSEQDHSGFMGESDHYFQRITQESAMHELTSLNSKQARRWLAQSGIDDPIPGLLKMLEAAKPAEAATTLARHYQQQSDWKAFEALLGHQSAPVRSAAIGVLALSLEDMSAALLEAVFSLAGEKGCAASAHRIFTNGAWWGQDDVTPTITILVKGLDNPSKSVRGLLVDAILAHLATPEGRPPDYEPGKPPKLGKKLANDLLTELPLLVRHITEPLKAPWTITSGPEPAASDLGRAYPKMLNTGIAALKVLEALLTHSKASEKKVRKSLEGVWPKLIEMFSKGDPVIGFKLTQEAPRLGQEATAMHMREVLHPAGEEGGKS